MCHYEPLKRYLEKVSSTVNEQLLTFEEIEIILNCKLPNSAFEHRAWWSNPTSPANHSYAQSWLQVGWKVDEVKLQDRWVRFRRMTSNNIKDIDHSIESTEYPHISTKTIIEKEIGTSQAIDNLQLLLNLGFEEVGRWSLEGDTLQFQLDSNENERNILYAFVVLGNVNYIGKSAKTLGERMNGYRNPGPTQTTNKNNNKWIRELLQTSTQVQIFSLVPHEELLYKGFPVNIAAGLEDNLLAHIKPLWNKRK